MTEGERLVLAWMRRDWNLAPSAGAQADLARRIDAALDSHVKTAMRAGRALGETGAELKQIDREAWKQALDAAQNEILGELQEEITTLQAALAAREAQCAALREALSRAIQILEAAASPLPSQLADFRAALTDTAAAARAVVARVEEAAAEQMRERAAQLAFDFWARMAHEFSDGDREREDVGRQAAGACAKAIRALPPRGGAT
jgi:chromosome segregation ATPase